MDKYLKNSVLQKLESPELSVRNIELFVKRDDLIHPFVSGNKWRKLKYYIEKAKSQNKNGILTFGGAFSNHLLAVAACTNVLEWKSIGIVRGEELNSDSNSLLKKCNDLGMKLIFLSREEYSLRNDWDFKSEYANKYNEFVLVPEGGAGYEGMIGCQEIVSELETFDHLFLAMGTATTAAGLLLACPENSKIHGVSAIKNFKSAETIQNLYKNSGIEKEFAKELLENFVNHGEAHFGGYAKTTLELLEFISEMKEKFALPLDNIYTGKAFFAMWQELIGNLEYENSRVVYLHTGGVHELG